MNHHIERYFSLGELTTEEPQNDSPGRLTGYVNKWGVRSHDRGGYLDTFRATAFSNLSESSHDVKAYLDHNDGHNGRPLIYLGRTPVNLKLTPDAIGLRFSLDLPNTQQGRDTAELQKAGHFNGMSFGYLPGQYNWTKENGVPVREHTSGTLIEVSVVFDPAFPKTNVQLNALSDPDEETLESLQRFLGTPNRDFAERVLRLKKK